MDELTKRNINALAQGLKEQRAKTSEMNETIKSLQGTVAQLQAQLAEIQNQTFAILAATHGGGATAGN